MNCPSCKEVKLLITERQGIEIDYCPECRGIWLDRGELDKLIEKSLKVESRPKNDYSDSNKDYDNDFFNHSKKKKGKAVFWKIYLIFDVSNNIADA
ncbi:hypothetical protein MROS_1049 [Melioribacter roseus P3M-2]|uniref:Transcription factor zinc-finger domain-containing protein n=1 Tax=Melioribacter roseus (strain DSM 23840 / JCM 17771 / VKM B-2668 / P3M-2) TaxID=1191523 RepID=I6ZQD7_MELRP|nr:zf-TFIIB domain-containing protein [Melioribacter roseus]AFN74289.1 hypothetical protein MROS_1049 [Melioribacter roseus P3M-2]